MARLWWFVPAGAIAVLPACLPNLPMVWVACALVLGCAATGLAAAAAWRRPDRALVGGGA